MKPALQSRTGPPYLAARLAVWATTGMYYAGAAAVRPGRRSATFTDCLIRLGPTFVKGGQLLSTRADVLSPSLCGALGRLTDRMDSMPGEAAGRTLTVYRRGREWPFA